MKEAEYSDNDGSSQDPLSSSFSGRGLSEKTKWANQALCLGVWTIPHKGREARAELKMGYSGAASLPAFSASLTCSEVP